MHQGDASSLYFFQDSNRNEIDILVPKGNDLRCFEIKSASTYHPSMRKYLQKMINNYPKIKEAHLIYNGKSKNLSDDMKLIHFKKAFKFFKHNNNFLFITDLTQFYKF